MLLACSRRSDSGTRAKNKASKRAGKKRGETLPQSPLVFFPALSLAFLFPRAPPSRRLEQANMLYQVAASFVYVGMKTSSVMVPTKATYRSILAFLACGVNYIV